MSSEKVPAFPSASQVLRLGRKWPGKPPEKKDWKHARRVARFAVCEHCGLDLSTHGVGFASKREALRFRGAVDHIVPERLAVQISRKNPHDKVNLMTLAAACHGVKTSADKYLCEGDTARFLGILEKHGWPMDRVYAALAFYGVRP